MQYRFASPFVFNIGFVKYTIPVRFARTVTLAKSGQSEFGRSDMGKSVDGQAIELPIRRHDSAPFLAKLVLADVKSLVICGRFS
jgi:hypothetical protein